MRISLPREGLSPLVYYQGSSEPATAALLRRLLRPGMIFADVGAHIGEFTLVAARAVGPSGQVHAFEPVPELLGFLEANVRLNALGNVTLVGAALADRPGEMLFDVRERLATSSLRPPRAREAAGPDGDDVERTLRIPALRLDDYFEERRAAPNVVKVDVEGAETLVFRGAERLLGLPADRAPVWLFECSKSSYARFGFDLPGLLAYLGAREHEILEGDADGRLAPFRPEVDRGDTFNIVARRRGPA